jgi:DNA replication protein DnaC
VSPGSMRRRGASGSESRCPMGLCDGSGWIDQPDGRAASCECREDRIRKVRAKGVSSVIPAKYRGAWFDRPPVTLIENQAAVRDVRRYVEHLEERLKDGRGLWLMGDVGTGKTTLAMIVSKAALEAGRTVAIYSLPDLLRRIRRTFGDEQGEQSHDQFFERLVSVDLLHLDDLGAEKASEWVIEELYSLINRRWEDERAVMVTTNLDQEQLEGQIGRRTVSRLVEICGDPLPLFGDDLRYRPESLAPRSGDSEAA